MDIQRILTEGYSPGRELPAAAAKLDSLGKLEREELSLKIECAQAAVQWHPDGILKTPSPKLQKAWRTLNAEGFALPLGVHCVL